jgi:large subunit ribosomal protein L24
LNVSIGRIKKGDEVVITTGVDAGKTGKVLRVDRVKGRAYVEGLNIRRCTIKRSSEHPQGGMVDKEAGIALSNLMPYDPSCEEGCPRCAGGRWRSAGPEE